MNLKISYKKKKATGWGGGGLAQEQGKGLLVPQKGAYGHVNLGGRGTSWNSLPWPSCLTSLSQGLASKEEKSSQNS